MRNRSGEIGLFCWAIVLAAGSPAAAQYSSIATPFNTLGDGFFEHVGVGFSFNGPGFFFEQNGMGAAVPPFGGFAPGAGLTGGMAFGFGGGQGRLNFTFGQGSSRGLVSATPSVTVPGGVWGGFFDTSQTPFVVNVVPVVGDERRWSTPLAERLERLKHEPTGDAAVPATSAKPASVQSRSHASDVTAAASSAARPAGSLVEMRRQREAELAAQVAEVDELTGKAERALAANKPGLAKLYFQQAARRAAGDAQLDLQRRALAAGEMKKASPDKSREESVRPRK